MKTSLVILTIIAAGATAFAQDVYPEWAIPGDDEFCFETITPDFDADGIYYHIIPGKDGEVAVMNNHPLTIYHNGEPVTFLEALDWAVEKPYAGDIVVPTAVTHDNRTYDVTTILYGAFAKAEGLKSVRIPESVTEIRGGIFGGCKALTVPQIPDLYAELPSWTYVGCVALKSVDLRQYKTIGVAPLAGCYGLEEAVTTGALAQIEALRSRYDTRDAIGVDPDLSGSLRHVYVTSPDAAGATGYDPMSFADSEYAEATLYVPAGSKDAFAASPFWSRFAHIEEGGYSGLDDCVAEQVEVSLAGSIISVSGLDSEAEIYDTLGRRICILTPANPISYSLASGLYVVRTPAGAKKVVVK